MEPPAFKTAEELIAAAATEETRSSIFGAGCVPPAALRLILERQPRAYISARVHGWAENLILHTAHRLKMVGKENVDLLATAVLQPSESIEHIRASLFALADKDTMQFIVHDATAAAWARSRKTSLDDTAAVWDWLESEYPSPGGSLTNDPIQLAILAHYLTEMARMVSYEWALTRWSSLDNQLKGWNFALFAFTEAADRIKNTRRFKSGLGISKEHPLRDLDPFAQVEMFVESAQLMQRSLFARFSIMRFACDIGSRTWIS